MAKGRVLARSRERLCREGPVGDGPLVPPEARYGAAQVWRDRSSWTMGSVPNHLPGEGQDLRQGEGCADEGVEREGLGSTERPDPFSLESRPGGNLSVSEGLPG